MITRMTPRFERYAHRKTNEAVAARLPGFVTTEERPENGRDLVRIGNDWTRALFGGWFYRTATVDGQRQPVVSLVFVQSADGNTEADDPSTLGGGETDKHLVYEGLSRVDADAVLAGASTASGDEIVFSIWHPEMVRLRLERRRSRHPVQAIVTQRGELPIETALLYNEPSLRVIVIGSTRAAANLRPRAHERPWIDVLDTGEAVDLRRGLEELYARGITVVSAIGGRKTAQALIAADAVADLYLTTSPLPGGSPGTPLTPQPLPPYSVVLEKEGREGERGVKFEYVQFAAAKRSAADR
jgi:riboflavin biosynthesis pyrimidine reductase